MHWGSAVTVTELSNITDTTCNLVDNQVQFDTLTSPRALAVCIQFWIP